MGYELQGVDEGVGVFFTGMLYLCLAILEDDIGHGE